MSMQSTAAANRTHIAFFGRRNAGKSSLVNAVTNQRVSVVSDTLGTTTDPVSKAMELLPLGPVMIIDTPGFDDEGSLGALRVERAREVLRRTDIAVLVADAALGVGEAEALLIKEFRDRGLPYLIAMNKSDLLTELPPADDHTLYVSALTGDGVHALKERLSELRPQGGERRILADLVSAGDCVVLVIPVDAAAPKGRLIMPQQMTLRELLDIHATALCCQPEELSGLLSSLERPPRLVVTDSQAFGRVSRDVPAGILLTSFSILFARFKGTLESQVRGAVALSRLKDGDRVLISEGCTHHRQCGDIGTEKLPRWIESYTGSKPAYRFTSGAQFEEDLSDYRLIVHCGGCMLNEKEMRYRERCAADAGVPMLNYGVAIALMHGILPRALEPFEGIAALLD